MTLRTPKIGFVSSRLFTGRQTSAVFVRKHSFEENLSVIESEIQPFDRIDPKDCLFLVEGHKRYVSSENLFLDNFIDERKIKSEDPVVPPFSVDIAESISLNRVVGALSVLTMDYFDFLADKIKEFDEEDTIEIFNQSLDTVAALFEVSPSLLRREFEKISWTDESEIAKELIQLKKERDRLINKSNEISKENLLDMLEINKERFVFIMSGIEHEPVFVE